MLRLEAKAVPPLVDVSLFARDGAVQEISRIKLDSGLSSGDFQHAPAGRFVHACSQREAVAFAVNHPVVVVAVAQHELFVIIVDARAHSRGLGEIERSSFDRSKFTRWDEILIDRSEAVGVERDFVIENVAVAFSGQVEITVLGKIDRRGLVRSRFVINDQFVIVGQRVGHSEL